MFVIIAFFLKFKNITLILFLELFGGEHKFLKILKLFFLQIIWKSLYFYVLLKIYLNKYNLIMNFQN